MRTISTAASVVSKDGTRIAFDRIGAGPALVLVGGAFQFRAIEQRTAALAALLGDRFAVFHYDRRGRGDSTDTAPYDVNREIEDLGAVISAAGGPAFVFGMSSGAVLALEAALAGLPIRALALYEPPFHGGSREERDASTAYARGLAELLAAGRRGDAAALAMATFGTPPEAVAGMRRSPVWPLFESVAPTLAYDAKIMGDRSLPAARLAAVRVPAVVIAGGSSPAFLQTAAADAARAVPGAVLRVLEGQRHDVVPEVLAPVLKEIFRT